MTAEGKLKRLESQYLAEKLDAEIMGIGMTAEKKALRIKEDKIAEEKGSKLCERVSRIASTRMARGDFINPFRRHQYTNKALFMCLYRQYEEELRKRNSAEEKLNMYKCEFAVRVLKEDLTKPMPLVLIPPEHIDLIANLVVERLRNGH